MTYTSTDTIQGHGNTDKALFRSITRSQQLNVKRQVPRYTWRDR